MDELDSKIIQLMMRNARMPVKEIAKQVNLTSPAVSSRIHRMEQEGIIGGYTVRLHHPGENNRVQALISIQTAASERDHFLKMIQGEPAKDGQHQHPDHSCHTAGPQSEPGRGRINGIAYL